MKLIQMLFSYYRKMLKLSSKKYFNEGKINQLKFLASLSVPENNFERSFNQYLGQKYLTNKFLLLINTFSSVILLPIFIFKSYKFSFIENEKTFDCVFLSEGVDETLIPNSLRDKYRNIINVHLHAPGYLTISDLKFIFEIAIKYWRYPEFILKNTVKISTYSKIIKEYKPSAIISHIEYSFSSSVLTEYCERSKIEHINIMHGEKLFNIRDSYCNFSKFYVWDKHYVELFEELKCRIEQFVVEKPHSLLLKESIKTSEYKYAFTYFLSDEDESTLKRIKLNLLALPIEHSKISVRLHPRYSEPKIIKTLFKEFNIQTGETDIADSLNQTKYSISLYSTVNYQAYLKGTEVIIDDLSNKELYKKLEDLNYIMISKTNHRLSDYIEV